MPVVNAYISISYLLLLGDRKEGETVIRYGPVTKGLVTMEKLF